jgi:hypothetical protein
MRGRGAIRDARTARAGEGVEKEPEEMTGACPFCGSTNCDVTSTSEHVVVRVVCLSCNAQGPPGYGSNYTDAANIARQRWKRRKSIISGRLKPSVT